MIKLRFLFYVSTLKNDTKFALPALTTENTRTIINILLLRQY